MIPTGILAVYLGDLPAWLAAFGTIFSFLVGFGVLRMQADDRRTAYAAKVAAWLRTEVTADACGCPTAVLDIIVWNGADVPLYNVWLDYWVSNKREDCFGGHRVDVVPPQTTISHTIPFDEDEIRREVIFDCVALEFTDAAGRYWKRDDVGRLRPIRRR
jgi:hypothetical protein